MHALTAAFVATNYRVDAGDRRFDLRVGHKHPRFDRYLRAHSRAAAARAPTVWAIVSAWNPGGVCADAARNAERQRALAKRAAEGRWRTLPVAHLADDGAWPVEAGLLLIGAGENEARALAAEFAQAAIVCGNIAGSARLVWVERK